MSPNSLKKIKIKEQLVSIISEILKNLQFLQKNW
jgi:hypothetical protein